MEHLHYVGNSPRGRFAGEEWLRFWTQLTGRAAAWTDRNNAEFQFSDVETLGPEYHVEWKPGAIPALQVTAATDIGLLHGVYDAIQRILGVEFTIAADILPAKRPDPRQALVWDAGLPLATIRGTLPWFNFLTGPSYWVLILH